MMGKLGIRTLETVRSDNHSSSKVHGSALRGKKISQVPEDYLQDDFNLTGLSSQVPYYDYALDMVLDVDSPQGALTPLS